MTAGLDQAHSTMNSLIRSCRDAHYGYRLASESAIDSNLKRLFSIYAHQRTRFAEELRGYLGETDQDAKGSPDCSDWLQSNPNTDRELLQNCLKADRQLLDLYQQAMKTGISAKAQFLLSAQFSLIQRVHERINGLLDGSPKPAGRISVSVERAVL